MISQITAVVSQLQVSQLPIPKFNPAADNVEDWLAAFESTIPNETLRVSRLGIALQASAASWYASQLRVLGRNNRSWSQWRAALVAEFSSHQRALFTTLLNHTQRPGQDPIEFYRKTIQLCRQVNAQMQEPEILNHLLRGIEPSLRDKLILMCPTTSADFLAKLQLLCSSTPIPTSAPNDQAKLIETLALALVEKQQPHAVEPQFYQRPEHDELYELRVRVRELERQLAEARSRPSSPQEYRRCFLCGRQGHIARFCRSQPTSTQPRSRHSSPNFRRNNRYSPPRFNQRRSPSPAGSRDNTHYRNIPVTTSAPSYRSARSSSPSYSRNRSPSPRQENYNPGRY